MIIFVHLLNDLSGSPKILANAIRSLVATHEDLILVAGSHGFGHLDGLGIKTVRYWYKRANNRLLTLFYYLFSQIVLFITLLRMKGLPKDAIIYINTLLPFGAAIFGVLTGRVVIYHLHEVSLKPALLQKFLVSIVSIAASECIYVSNFHRNSLQIRNIPSRIIYNSLDMKFIADAKSAPSYMPLRGNKFRILMIASLRDYKGVPEFLSLANNFLGRTDVSFDLIANEDLITINRYFLHFELPSNLTIYSRTNNLSYHYSNASLLLNLTRPDLCQETFGLTILEALTYGVPVIAPPVGGVLEMVRDGNEGFLVDSRDSALLIQRINELISNPQMCRKMSVISYKTATKFSLLNFESAIRSVVNGYFQKAP